MEQGMNQDLSSMTKTRSPETLRHGAFSLIELLVVIGIMLVVLTFAAPAVSSLVAGVNLSRGGQQFADQILLGRQTALTRNRDVEIRFVKLTNNTPAFRGVQVWMVDEGGTSRSPVGRMTLLPEGIIISTNATLSPLLFGNGATISGETNFGSYGRCQYAGFRFRANGQTDLPTGKSTNSANFITLQNLSAQGDPPENFFAIQINPLTGKVAVLRP